MKSWKRDPGSGNREPGNEGRATRNRTRAVPCGRHGQEMKSWKREAGTGKREPGNEGDTSQRKGWQSENGLVGQLETRQRMKRVIRREDYSGETLAMRLEAFGGNIVRVCESLPRSRPGRLVADQLLRSGTAAGAHYNEAQGAQSTKDFIHKVSLALKEAREARYWLGVARGAGYAADHDVGQLAQEATQIIAILHSSQTTARRRGGS